MKASRWLYTKINQTVTASNATGVAVEVFDHAGWDQPKRIGVLTDYVDLGLTEFVRMIITTVSDPTLLHGYPAAMTFESKFGDHSRFIHTSLDRADTININHVLQHVTLVIGFAYELGFAPLGNEDITEEL
ncbi:unnamed protein product [Aspergillus oryzae]|nr:unnamed protein product [Aspergillus oryzae]